jgi:hypothetical protein
VIKPPSLIREYTWIWSRDPALNSPPPDASDEDKKEWERKLKIARETGQWDALISPGQSPTRFSLRLIPGDDWRKYIDEYRNQGVAAMTALAVRLALRGVHDLTDTDGKEVKVKLEPASGFGKIASPDIINALDAVWLAITEVDPTAPNIVGEMANAISDRQNGPSPK